MLSPDAEGVKTWGVKSAKWAQTHDTGVKVVDENVIIPCGFHFVEV